MSPLSPAVLQSPTITSSETICYTQYMYQELSCDVPNSNPGPTVTWYRGSAQVQYSSRIGTSLSHKLVFNHMLSSDAAQWICRVSNGTVTYDSSSYGKQYIAWWRGVQLSCSVPPTQSHAAAAVLLYCIMWDTRIQQQQD